MGLHPYLFCLSFYHLYFVLPPFEDNRLPFWVPDVSCQRSEVVLWNLLSVQMLFWWICGGESGLPILFLYHFRTAPFQRSFLPLSLFSFWDPYNANVSMPIVSQSSLNLSSFQRILFCFCCYFWVISTTLSSGSLICSSLLSNLLLITSSVFSLQLCIFLNLWLVFIFYKHLWSSHCVHPFFSKLNQNLYDH